ncbi:hypothetical protein [Priestia aryabhattai]
MMNTVKEKITANKVRSSIIGVIAVLGIVFTSITIHNDNVNQYERDLRTTVGMIENSSIDAEYMIDEYSTAWSSSIDYGGDFNTRIDMEYAEFEENGDIDTIEKSQKKIKVMMKKLNNPPKQFEEEHEHLLNMYGHYKTYSELSIFPDGSLLTYNEKTQDLKEQIDAEADKLETMIEVE